MEVKDVIERVNAILLVSRDDERAHAMEDKLWEDVLMAISQGAACPDVLAEAALATKNIQFSRWYA